MNRQAGDRVSLSFQSIILFSGLEVNMNGSVKKLFLSISENRQDLVNPSSEQDLLTENVDKVDRLFKQGLYICLCVCIYVECFDPHITGFCMRKPITTITRHI